MKIEIKERPDYTIIDVDFDNNEYRFIMRDNPTRIEITKSDGAIEIYPKVSNQILIK